MRPLLVAECAKIATKPLVIFENADNRGGGWMNGRNDDARTMLAALRIRSPAAPGRNWALLLRKSGADVVPACRLDARIGIA